MRKVLAASLLMLALGVGLAHAAELLNGSAPAPNPAGAQQRAAPRPHVEPGHAQPPASAQPAPRAPQAGGPAAAPATPEATNQPVAQGQGIDAWAVQCADNGKNCLMLRRVLRPDNKSQILAMTIARAPNSPDLLVGNVMLPLGIAVRESVPIALDERYLASVPIETCVQAGCVLTMPLTPQLQDVLQKSSVMKFLLLTPNQATLPVSMGMQGFREALAKIRSN